MSAESEYSPGDVEPAPSLDFDTYIADQWNALWRFAYLITGHVADAEDLVQDALSKVWPRWSSICAMGDPGAYLRRCIANAKVSRWRRAHRESPYADVSARLKAVDDQTEGINDALTLARVIRTLPTKQRAAIGLRYLDDYSYEDIALLCSITQATARSLVRNALHHLRQEMAKKP